MPCCVTTCYQQLFGVPGWGLISIFLSIFCKQCTCCCPILHHNMNTTMTAIYHYCNMSLQDSPRLVMYCMLPFFFFFLFGCLLFLDIWNGDVTYVWLLFPFSVSYRQCHLIVEFALGANHLTSVSKIHVPPQSQIALKCFLFFCMRKKKTKLNKNRTKNIFKKPCFGSEGIFVCFSFSKYKRPFPFAHEINEDVFIHLW